MHPSPYGCGDSHSADHPSASIQPPPDKRVRTNGNWLSAMPADICTRIARAYVDNLLSDDFPFDCTAALLSFAGISSKYMAAIQAVMPTDLCVEINCKPTNLAKLIPLVRMNVRRLHIVDSGYFYIGRIPIRRKVGSRSECQLSHHRAIQLLTSSPNLREIVVPRVPSIIKTLPHCKQLKVITMLGSPAGKTSRLLWCDTLAKINIEQLNIYCCRRECWHISECASVSNLIIFFDMLDERNICQGLKRLDVICNLGNLKRFYSTLSFPHLECLTPSSDVPVDTVAKWTSLKSVRLEGRAANLHLANGLGSLVSKFRSSHIVEDFEMLLPCTALSELDVITSPFAIQNFPRALTTLRELRLKLVTDLHHAFVMPPNTILDIVRLNPYLTHLLLEGGPLDIAEVIRILQIPGKCLELFIIRAELPDDITWDKVADVFNAAAAHNPRLRRLDFGLDVDLVFPDDRDGPLLRNQDGSFSDCGPAVRQALMKLKRRAPEFEDDYDSLL